MKVTILGGGKWGTALTVLYSNKFKEVNFWIRPESKYKGESLAEYAKKRRINPLKFPNIKIPLNVNITSNLYIVNESDIVISTIPSAYLEDYFKEMKNFNFLQFINASKGVIDGKPIFFSYKKYMNAHYATLSGPNIAGDVIGNFAGNRINPSFATIAGVSEQLAKDMEFIPYLRLQYHSDVKSVEYCGILKQIYAMVLGICVGLKYSGNTIAGVFHASGKEIKKILKELGGDPKVYDETYAGYPDLEVTYKYGRHGKIGRLIATKGVIKAKKEMQKECVEGFRVLQAIYNANSRLNLPILNELYSIIYSEKSLEKAVSDLVNS
jgi:glycerol-3-phosphate dehydrogenase (NAD(P)+)